MREDQIDQFERRATLDNDLKVLQQQGSTFHQHAQAQADELSQGRFAATRAPRVIGSTPTPASQYPAASAAHQTELPPEPPLGFDNPTLDEPSTASSPPFPAVEQLGGADGAPSSSLSPDVVEHAAPPPSNTDDGNDAA